MSGTPAAWAFDSDVGIRITGAPAQNAYDTPLDGASAVGIRLTAAPTQGTYDTQTGTTTVGIRLTATPAQNSYDTPGEGASHVGIRLTAQPEQNEYDSKSGSSTVGIRLTAQPEQSAYDTPLGGTSAVGIRLTATPAQNAYEVPAGASNVGIRLTGMQTLNVYFATHGGSKVPMQQVRWGECAKQPETDPTRTAGSEGAGSYKFLGWFADEACTQPFDFSQPIRETMTIHAGWSHLVDVTLHANGAVVTDASAGWDANGLRTVENCWTGRGYDEYFDGFPALDALGLALPSGGGQSFGGWWTYDESTGEWGRQVADATTVLDGATVSDDATHLWARWIENEYWLEVIDSEGGTTGWTPGGTDASAKVVHNSPLPAGDALYAGDATPKRAGYSMAGLWQEAEEPQQYYAPRGDALEVASALDGKPWTDWQRATDRYKWNATAGADGNGAWVLGHDGVDDTIVLTPRWHLEMSATVPVSLGFAITGFGDEPPVAIGPDADEFAIRSTTPTHITVAGLTAVGLPGLESVLYTTGEGASRRLDYGELGAAIELTLDPEEDESARATLAIADVSGRAGDGAVPPASVTPSEAFALEAWRPAGVDGSDGSPTELHIKFGLTLPDGIRAYESGAKGDVARVTFTLTAQQAV